MSPRLSIQLDAVRLAAALAVVCAHAQRFLLPELPAWLSHNGHEAVSIFFVLSGFVIAYSVEDRAVSLRDYISSRIARLYSVVIPCLAVAIAIDWVGMTFYTRWYQANHLFSEVSSVSGYISYLTFTNEIWYNHIAVGSAEPFWSLGFEVPYYALFAIAAFAKRWTRIVLCSLWVIAVGPKVLLYLPLWLMGVAAWKVAQSERLCVTREAFLIVLSTCLSAYISLKSTIGEGEYVQFRWYSAQLSLLTFTYHAFIGLITAVAIVALAVRSRSLRGYDGRLAAAIRWFAGGSFTLYLLHQPLLAFAAATMTASSPVWMRGLALGGILFVTYGVAAIGERRKILFDRGFRRLMRWSDSGTATKRQVMSVS